MTSENQVLALLNDDFRRCEHEHVAPAPNAPIPGKWDRCIDCEWYIRAQPHR